MSEENTETPPENPEAPTAPETTQTDPPENSQQEPTAGKEPPWFMKRINDMNRRNADLAREMEALKQERDLLRQAKPDDGATKPADKPITRDEIRAEAQRIAAEERFNEQRQALITEGAKEHGQDTWNAKTQVIAALGALDVPAFMEALVDLPAAHKLVVALADEPDKLQTLLAKRPTAMAAEMGRMAAELAMQKPKTLSKTPAPPNTIGSGRAAPPPDTSKMTAKEYIAFRARTAPKHLGGRGEAA